MKTIAQLRVENVRLRQLLQSMQSYMYSGYVMLDAALADGGETDVRNMRPPYVTMGSSFVLHKVGCKLFPDPFDERDPVGPCTCGAIK